MAEILLLLALLVLVTNPAELDWKCTDQFCQKVICPDMPTQCSNDSASALIASIEPCNCCDHCLLFQGEGDHCLKSVQNRVPGFICAPGLTCNDLGQCEKMKQKDPQLFPNYICKSGRCKCAIMTSSGEIKTIFGEFPEEDLKKNETQCECSIVAYKAMTQILRALPFKDVFQPTPRCLRNGQFDPLQCMEDQCGCVDKETGAPDENGFSYYVKTLEKNHPKCFNVSTHVNGYYSHCESRRNRLMKLRNSALWEDVDLIHLEVINCRPDGNYA